VDKTLVPSPKPNNPVFDNEEKSKVKKRITVLEFKEIFQVQFNLGSVDHVCCIILMIRTIVCLFLIYI